MLFRELNNLIPRVIAIHARTDDERRPSAAIEPLGNRGDEIRVRM
jgi:hypothetical protein